MTIVKHKFQNHSINPKTETLILGTFNPEGKENEADFFYGRKKNELWDLLPTALGKDSLYMKPKADKLAFIVEHRIDFIDIIQSLKVEAGEETNYKDTYIDGRVNEWRDVIVELKSLKHLKKIGFTRRGFSGVPNIKERIDEVNVYCNANGILFHGLVTPSRAYRGEKQSDWNEFMSKP